MFGSSDNPLEQIYYHNDANGHEKPQRSLAHNAAQGEKLFWQGNAFGCDDHSRKRCWDMCLDGVKSI